jgi:hypothetical protein
MAVKLITREIVLGQGVESYLDFDGVVRQFAIGIGRWHLRFAADPSHDPGHLDHLGLRVVPRQEPGERQRIYFRVEASVSGVWPAILPEASHVWVSCIADVGRHERDYEADPCVSFRSQIHPTTNVTPLETSLPAEHKLAEAFFCGVDYYYTDSASETDRSMHAESRLYENAIDFRAGVRVGDASWSNSAPLGFAAVARSEGRVFAKSIFLERVALGEGFSIDFSDLIGHDVRLDATAIAFPRRFFIDPAVYAGAVAELAVGALCRVEGSRVMLDGPVLYMPAHGANGSTMSPNAFVELVVFVRTEPVVITDHRGDVDIRLVGARGHEHWEYQVAGHWHEISRSSDVLEWQAQASGEHVRVTISNACERPIRLTVNGEPLPGALPVGQRYSTTASSTDRRNIAGWFVKDDPNDHSEPLPDPIFEVIKQGGG